MTYHNLNDSTVRETVFKKYGGKCAYCGIELDFNNCNIDHIEPLRRKEYKLPKGANEISNYNPSCVSCNCSKGVLSIEKWREAIHHKLVSINRDSASYRILKRYELIEETGRRAVFYFEDYIDLLF